MSALEFGRRLLSSGEAFVFPRSCLWCSSPLPASGGSAFCRGCRAGLAPRPGPRCLRCSAPVGPHLETSQGCIHCASDPFAFRRVISLGPYDGLLRQACRRCKWQHNHALSTGLTELLWEQERENLTSLRVDFIIPVPHHWSDRLLRPRQPPEAIAERLGVFLMVPLVRHILFKAKRTPRQLSLSPSDRRRNLRSAFDIAGHWAGHRGGGSPGTPVGRLRGRTAGRSEPPARLLLDEAHVLLVDDVLTTGTTAQQASRVLLRAGAASVLVVVLARGIGA